MHCVQLQSREQAHKREFCSASLSKVGGQAHWRRRLRLAALLIRELHRLCEALVTVLQYTAAVAERQAAPLSGRLGGQATQIPDREVRRGSDADSGTWPEPCSILARKEHYGARGMHLDPGELDRNWMRQGSDHEQVCAAHVERALGVLLLVKGHKPIPAGKTKGRAVRRGTQFFTSPCVHLRLDGEMAISAACSQSRQTQEHWVLSDLVTRIGGWTNRGSHEQAGSGFGKGKVQVTQACGPGIDQYPPQLRGSSTAILAPAARIVWG